MPTAHENQIKFELMNKDNGVAIPENIKGDEMVIDIKYSGEDIRELVNSSMILRFGYDGQNVYLYLRDGSMIQIAPAIISNGNGNATCDLSFNHRQITKIK